MRIFELCIVESSGFGGMASSGCNLQDATKFSKKVSKCQKTTTSKSFLAWGQSQDRMGAPLSGCLASTTSYLIRIPVTMNFFNRHSSIIFGSVYSTALAVHAQRQSPVGTCCKKLDKVREFFSSKFHH